VIDSSAVSSVDRSATIAAAALVTSVGALFFNLMPLLVGALADERGYGEAQLGVFAAAGLAGVTLATATTPFWVRRVRWRRTIRVASGVAAAGYALAAVVATHAALVACMVGVGVAVAVAYAPALACIADTRDPDRSFGVTVFLQVTLGAVCAMAVSGIEAAWGVAGILRSLGAMTLSSLLLAHWIPDRGRAHEADTGASGTRRSSIGVLLGLLGILVFYLAVVGVWGFLELIGNAAGVADDHVVVAITLALLVGGLGALTAAVLSQRISQPVGIAIGSIALVLSFLALHVGEGYAAYLASTIGMNAAWNFGVSYQMALVAVLDVTGRFTVLVTAATGVGGMLGPALAGLLASEGSYGPVLAMGACATAVSLALFLLAARARRSL
jgi:predicted MFS family arabinose efflux permease